MIAEREELKKMAARIEAVERENRRLRRIMLTVVVLARLRPGYCPLKNMWFEISI